MKELLTYIVQSLVDHPDEVSVTERKADGETVFEVRVAEGDMGKVVPEARNDICMVDRPYGDGVQDHMQKGKGHDLVEKLDLFDYLIRS